MGIKERGSVEPQEEAVVNATPVEEERTGATATPSLEEVVTAEAASVSALPAVELLPMPAFLSPLEEVPAETTGDAAAALDVNVLPAAVAELRVAPVTAKSSPAFTTPIPEPASLTLLGLGALGLAGCGWRRRSRTA